MDLDDTKPLTESDKNINHIFHCGYRCTCICEVKHEDLNIGQGVDTSIVEAAIKLVEVLEPFRKSLQKLVKVPEKLRKRLEKDHMKI